MGTSPQPLGISGAFFSSAWAVLRHPYLRKDQNGAVVERPEEMFHQVARAVATVEANYKGNVDA